MLNLLHIGVVNACFWLGNILLANIICTLFSCHHKLVNDTISISSSMKYRFISWAKIQWYKWNRWNHKFQSSSRTVWATLYQLLLFQMRFVYFESFILDVVWLWSESINTKLNLVLLLVICWCYHKNVMQCTSDSRQCHAVLYTHSAFYALFNMPHIVHLLICWWCALWDI